MPRQRKSQPSPYHVLLVIGKIMDSETGRVHGKEFVASRKDSGYIYTILRRLVEYGFIVEAGIERGPKEENTKLRIYYSLTDKGKKLGDTYSARTIARNPPLVRFEDFK